MDCKTSKKSSTHREVSGFSTAARHCECEDEDDQGTTTGNGRRNNQVPLGKQYRFVTTEISLGEEAEHEERQHGRVDANRQPAEPSADDEGVEVVEPELGEVFVA